MTFQLCGERLKEWFLDYKLQVTNYELQVEIHLCVLCFTSTNSVYSDVFRR